MPDGKWPKKKNELQAAFIWVITSKKKHFIKNFYNSYQWLVKVRKSSPTWVSVRVWRVPALTVTIVWG